MYGSGQPYKYAFYYSNPTVIRVGSGLLSLLAIVLLYVDGVKPTLLVFLAYCECVCMCLCACVRVCKCAS